MNTSGDDAPPEIVVIKLARLVSVSVGADWRLTLMFGYACSNALISTVRGSGLVVVMGLAQKVMLPLVALPPALEAADDPPAAGELDEPDEPDEPLLHAAAVRATVTQAIATCADRRLPREIGNIFIDA
jgi:hypothetical protein